MTPLARLLPHVDASGACEAPLLAAALADDPRSAHELALSAPMVGCPWAGEPRVERGRGRRVEAPAWFDWWAANYAAALLRRREPAFAAGDLSHLRMRFEAPRTVLFIADIREPSGRRRAMAVAAVVLPAHVTGFCPAAPPGQATPFPREVPHLARAFPRHLEPAPMRHTIDNPPSRKRARAARSGEGLS